MNAKINGIDPDIRQAATLDTAFYTEEAMFREARERVFARSWQWLGDTRDVAQPGSVAPCEMLAGLLNEPLMLSRDADGNLRCLSNVCTHRGNILVHQACQLKEIRCGYHARRFDLAGTMLSMPEFSDAKNFPSTADNLPALPFGSWKGHAFASIAPAAPLAEFMAEIEARLSWMPIEDFVHDPNRDRDFDLDAHWALYVENYLEGFHIPFVHAGLNAVVEYGSYASEIGRYANLQLAIAREGEPAFDIPAGSPDHGKRVAAYYWWVFPNLMFNFYPWGLSLNLIRPQARERTRISFRSFVWDADKLEQGAGAGLDRVEMEDEEIVRAVQRGVRSRFYQHGRYSPTRERGVHHFHRLLCEFMAGAT